MKKARAILWDLDGTIVDSNACHLHTWEIVLESHGYRLNQDAFTENFGRKSTSMLTGLLGFEPEVDLMMKMIKEKEILFRQTASEWLTLIPGVLTWLEEARKKNIQQAIASSAPMENITTVLEIMNLEGYFTTIISGTGLPAKPHPEIFFRTAKALCVSPEECLVIEDATTGVEGAYNAGMPCIAVTTTHTPEELHLADLVIEDFTVPMNEILETLYSV